MQNVFKMAECESEYFIAVEALQELPKSHLNPEKLTLQFITMAKNLRYMNLSKGQSIRTIGWRDDAVNCHSLDYKSPLAHKLQFGDMIRFGLFM